jgi:hypothetical protein
MQPSVAPVTTTNHIDESHSTLATELPTKAVPQKAALTAFLLIVIVLAAAHKVNTSKDCHTNAKPARDGLSKL